MPYKIELVDVGGRAVPCRVWKGAGQPPKEKTIAAAASKKRTTKMPNAGNKKPTSRSTKGPTRKSTQYSSSSTDRSTPESDFTTSLRTPATSQRNSPEPTIYSPSSSDYSYLRYSTSLGCPPELDAPSMSSFSSPISELSEDFAMNLDAEPLPLYLGPPIADGDGDLSYHLAELQESLADPFTLIHGEHRAMYAGFLYNSLQC